MSTRSSCVVSSWPLDSGAGSGVARVASGLARALEAGGWDSELVSPSFSGEGYLSTTVKRILFNLYLRGDGRLHDGRPVIAFDFDGFLLPKAVRFAQINGGLLSDIAQFETGLVGRAVRLTARLEKLASMKADRIFTPSNYAARKIRDLYNVPPEKISVMHNGLFFHDWRKHFAAAPQCSPSRASMMTGLVPHRHGLMGLQNGGVWNMASDVPTLANRLRDLG